VSDHLAKVVPLRRSLPVTALESKRSHRRSGRELALVLAIFGVFYAAMLSLILFEGLGVIG
jgi:hypothetical protein